jgi:ankyrin repeat protein
VRRSGSPGDRVHQVVKAAAWLLSVLVFICTLAAEAPAGPNDDILAAAKAGDRSGVEAALASGASVNARDDYESTPLMLAAIYGHANVAAFLLDHGANLNAGDSVLGWTPITLAAGNGNVEVVKLLLGRGAGVNSRDKMDATPLHQAALSGQRKVASLLLAHGAIVNTQDFEGKTPLHYAASVGEADMISLLVAHGADLNLRNKEGQTPIQEAESSDIDAATKANVVAMLRATPKVKARDASPAQGTPAMSPATPIQPQSQSRDIQGRLPVPNCRDVGGIARLIIARNPRTDWTTSSNARVLVLAVEKMQVMLGCRPPPQKTQCLLVGDMWTCTTE